jgi:hypothetical protein
MTQISEKLPGSGGSASSLTNTHTDERLMVSSCKWSFWEAHVGIFIIVFQSKFVKKYAIKNKKTCL